jgi:hypothetical protein
MKKGFFFYGVYMLGDNLSVNKAYQHTLTIFSYPTNPFCPLLNQAFMAAKETPDSFLLQFLI